jgi:NAD(P)H-hydrate repair Nnr-like enzyme with NAD(P)H-hydrate dehydratase domain/NAD(P)H-hydrate repair Nnr-like enzyme with NAD(P)H-hydrate epimerase domain
MIRAYAVPDVRAVEAAAMAGLPDGELMQRAAAGLAEVLAARLRERDGSRIVALVGGGDNGGDALYAAALLAAQAATARGAGQVGDASQWEIVAICPASGAVHPGGRDAALAAGVTLINGVVSEPATTGTAVEASAETEAPWRQALAGADLVVDAITGIGGRPGLRPQARAWVDAIPESAYVVAVDLPSGLDPAGLVGTPHCVFADETVTFGVPKPCHLLPAGEGATGRLTVVDIGLAFSGCAPAVERLTHADVAARWPVPHAASDKYSRGVVGIVAGSGSYPGAGVLSVLGSLGAGVGMVRYLGPPEVAASVHRHAPEAVTATGRVQAWVLGSGVDPDDQDDRTQLRRIELALAGADPCVVDAGALSLIAERPGFSVLTPHAGELARLLTRLGVAPSLTDAGPAPSTPEPFDATRTSPTVVGASDAGEIENIVDVTKEAVVARPVEHAQAAADALGAVVLLKGSTTLVVCPTEWGRPIRSQADAPAWLATAGAGDVLGGVIGSLLAGGLDPADAATIGAIVHGVAADRANPGGPVRVLAVAHALPETIAAFLA